MICMAGRSGEKRTASLRRAWRGEGCSPGAGVLDPELLPRPRTALPGLAQGQTSRTAQQGGRSLGPLGAEGSGHSRIPGLGLAGALSGKGSASPGTGQWDTQGRRSPSQGLPVNQLQNISCNVELRLPLPLKLLLREKPGAEEP